MIRRVSGHSMRPAIDSGQIVFMTKTSVKVGSIVLARVEAREVIKRVKSIKENNIYLVGDNSHESTDSRHYGPVDKSAILGTIMIVLPQAIKPPKLAKSYGPILGRFAAGLLVVMALTHLFRIDTLVPILDAVLPGGYFFAGVVTVIILFSEIFAIPFALRMKLSPLMHLCSGVLLILAPIFWLWICIWSFGSDLEVGLLGEFVPIYATTLIFILNIAWLAFNYVTLHALGFNNLKIPSLLRK